MSGGGNYQAIVSGITSATTIVRVLLSAEQTFDKAELRLKLADLMVALADARTHAADQQAEIDRLTRDLSAANKQRDFSESMKFERPYYWNVVGDQRDGPYCQTCWDGRENLAIRLYSGRPGEWHCRTCKNFVEDDDYREPSQLEPDRA